MTASVGGVGGSRIAETGLEEAAAAGPTTAPRARELERVDMTRDHGEPVAVASRRASRPDVEAHLDGIADAYMRGGNDGVEGYIRANPRACEALARNTTPERLTERLGSELHERMTVDPFSVRSGFASEAIYGEIRETLRGTLMEEMRREASGLVERTLSAIGSADPEAVRTAIDSAPVDSPLWSAASRLNLIGGDPSTFGARLEDATAGLRALRGDLMGTTWEAESMPSIRDAVLARHGLSDSGITHDAIRPLHRERAEMAHTAEQMADLVLVGGSIAAGAHLSEALVEGGLSLAGAGGVAVAAEHFAPENFAAERLLGRN